MTSPLAALACEYCQASPAKMRRNGETLCPDCWRDVVYAERQGEGYERKP
jgi:hypothetical protein